MAAKQCLLLQGPPGVGKTTVVRRLVTLLQEVGVPVGGFTTREVRAHNRRVGFVVEAIDGPEAVIAHVDFAGGTRVGRYHVDRAAFEGVALPALEQARKLGGVVVIDELGRMELASDAFVRIVSGLFTRDMALVATVHVAQHPVTDELKGRFRQTIITVTPENRDELPARLRRLLVPDALAP